MTTIAPAMKTCPACHLAFQTLQLQSTNTFGQRTTDFYQFNGGMQALPYEVHTCPSCGFTGFDEAFEQDQVDESIVGLVNERIKPQVTTEQPTGGRRFEYAAWISIWERRSPLETAWLFLKAAWCYSLDEEPEQELEYRRQAITHFERAMEDAGVPTNEEVNYCYLIGELYRRVGDSAKATLWFDRAIRVAPDDD